MPWPRCKPLDHSTNSNNRFRVHQSDTGKLYIWDHRLDYAIGSIYCETRAESIVEALNQFGSAMTEH